MIVLGLVAVLASATAVYNRGIQRQIVLTREHATVLGLFIRARSAGFTTPREDPDEVVCGYGVHIDAASRTLVYFKDASLADCSTADHKYVAGSDSVIEQRILSDAVTVTSGDMTDVVYVPPFGKVFIDGVDAQAPASVIITSAAANASKGVKVNAFGQVTEFQPTP